MHISEGHQNRRTSLTAATHMKRLDANFGQSDVFFLAPGSFVGWPIRATVTTLGKTMQWNIPVKFGPICFSGSLRRLKC